MKWFHNLFPHGQCNFKIQDLESRYNVMWKGVQDLTSENEMLRIQMRILQSRITDGDKKPCSTLESSLNELLAKSNVSCVIEETDES